MGGPLVVTDDDISGTFTFVRALEEQGYPSDLTAEHIGRTWLNTIIEYRSILWRGGSGRLALIPGDCLIARLMGDIRDWHWTELDEWDANPHRIEAIYGYDRHPGMNGSAHRRPSRLPDRRFVRTPCPGPGPEALRCL